MARCTYCNTLILFGGARQGELRFCNEKCRVRGSLLSFSRQIPQHLVTQQIDRIHQGLCPSCRGLGPVDIHAAYEVWSALLVTNWKTNLHLCCKSCGRKKQITSALFSLVAGWWGFPWGFILTPLQITRNLIGIFGAPPPLRPSAKLENHVRYQLALKMTQAPRPPQLDDAETLISSL